MNRIRIPNFKFNTTICCIVAICVVYMYIQFYNIKTMPVMSKKTESQKVVIGGEPAGIRLLASGVLVMGIEKVETTEGLVNTVDNIDINIGDIILEVNDKKVETNKELINILDESKGEMLKLKISRQNKEHVVNMKPVLAKEDNKYKLGLWVKDSSAGVGTITFYDKSTRNFAGLGHGITETKENYILPILSGGLARTSILDINKGFAGSPGDLKGTLTTDIIAEIRLNTEYGIYGKMITDEYFKNKVEIETVKKEEIKEGKAEIYCSIEGNKVEKFQIKIIKVIKDSKTNKNMVIEITDERLLEKTGGIVQGMSGSPIIQNGKLVGAVTHVFLNEPKKGYGVFVENMLQDLKNIDN